MIAPDTTPDTTTTDAATTETALDADDTTTTDTCGRDAWAWCPCRRHERQRARLVVYLRADMK